MELVWMEAGKEEAEWWRLTHLEAWVANKLRFSKDDPIVHPKDINPFCKQKVMPQRKGMKDQMNDFWAANEKLPIQRMKQQDDGTWVEVKE